MFLLDAHNTAEYLWKRGLLEPSVTAVVEPLAWGVSNAVLRVTPDTGDAFVIKQSREQLRTADPWFSRLDRIWREVGIMRVVLPVLPAGVVPRILFEDRENYLFGMEAAPADHAVWKQLLLEGQADASIAERLGTFLAAIHVKTAGDSALRQEFGDREVFDQLRVDPFYRRVASAHPDVAPTIQKLIDEMYATQVCVVHADFSPKNVLVSRQGITLVDFETGHYGDPAFDLGFFLSHLLLKAVLHSGRFEDYAGLTDAFWRTYWEGMRPLADQFQFVPRELLRRSFGHLAACAWARIDGTSKVDYLRDEGSRERVRRFCRRVLLDPPADWQQMLGWLELG